MLRLISRLFVAILLLSSLSTAYAQQPAKVPRVGYITIAPLATLTPQTDAFRKGLRDLGYVEDKTIKIDLRSSEGDRDRLSKIAAELVQQNFDVIVTAGTGVTRAVKQATSTIAIVMAQDSDPVGNGFVTSLARPGRNITGLSTLSTDLVGKRFEILKESVPKLTLLAIMGSSSTLPNSRVVKEVENIAAAFGVKTQYLDIVAAKDIAPAFATAAKAGASGVLWVVSGPINLANRRQIIDLQVKHRLPVMYDSPNNVEAGGLMSYGVDGADLYQRAAVYVDKILKGAKAAELPVEQPIKFDFVVNLKTAKQIGLTIPPNVLVRANKVIR